MKLQTRTRSAFTLLEMLVVLSIIALLASITISAVFRLQSGQKESNTNTHLHKIEMLLVQQWNATIDQIKKENPPQVVKELTKNADGSYDIARAKALHMKLRLRQEFPQNFGEVASSVTLTYGGLTYKYLPKQSFALAIKNPQTSGPSTYVELSPEAQSAGNVVLDPHSGQGRCGGEPGANWADHPARLSAKWRRSSIQLRVFRDEWNNQIAFRRLADDDFTDVLTELNQKPFVSDAQIASGNMDPQDPEGRLKLQGWPGRVQALSFLSSSNPNSRPYIVDPFDGRNRGPFAFSAGRDKKFYTPDADDNLYSYRLQQTGQGN